MKHNCNDCCYHNVCNTYLDAPDCINPNTYSSISVIDNIKNLFSKLFRK